LGKSHKTGKAKYGPKVLPKQGGCHRLEFLLYATIDGKKQDILLSVSKENSLTHFSHFGVHVGGTRKDENDMGDYKLGSVVDFWAFNQSCSIRVSETEVGDEWTDAWTLGSQRLKALIKKLPAGSHSVKLELCYRLHSDSVSVSRHFSRFPHLTTPVSKPIAVGEFRVDTNKAPITLGRIFPLRNTKAMSHSEARLIENEIKIYLTKSHEWGSRAPKAEKPIHVVLSGDWNSWQEEVYRRESRDIIVKTVVTHHSVSFDAFFLRTPSTGWWVGDENIPLVVGFHLEAYVKDTPPGGKPQLPIVGIGVGRLAAEFEQDLLPDEILQSISN